jgi:Zn-dependent protease with chaperone function
MAFSRAVFGGIIFGVGYSRYFSMITAFTIALMSFSVYWFSDKSVLRMYGARELSEGKATTWQTPSPRLFHYPGRSGEHRWLSAS